MSEPTTARGKRRQARIAEQHKTDHMATLRHDSELYADYLEEAYERRLRRDFGIRDAVAMGIPLREVAEAAGISHTAVAKIAKTAKTALRGSSPKL